MKKRIGFIARGLTPGGVERFVEQMLIRFKNSAAEEFFIYTDEAEFVNRYPEVTVRYISRTNKLVWDYLLLPMVASKDSLDALIYTKNIIPFSHTFFSWKKIVVVYDLAFMYPDLKAYKFFDSLYMRLFLGLSLRLADEVLAISKFTKSEIKKFYPHISVPITVMYLGVSDDYKKVTDTKRLSEVRKKYTLEEPFIFYCGSLSPRKNILRTLQAFYEIKDEVSHMFYLISGKSWNEEKVLEYIESNLQDRVRILPYISEEDLIVLYSLADAYIYPSLYEGFGLPIIEAQACECPVLTSETTSCGEVAGEGAVLVEPTDLDEMRTKLHKMLKSSKKKSVDISEAKENIHRFYWDATYRIVEGIL